MIDDGKTIFVPVGFPGLHELKAIAAERGWSVLESANVPSNRAFLIDKGALDQQTLMDWFNE